MSKNKIRETCEICKNEFIHGYEERVRCPICKQEYEWDEDQEVIYISLSENQKEILRTHSCMRSECEIREVLNQVVEGSHRLKEDDTSFGKYLIAIQTLKWVLGEFEIKGNKSLTF